MNILMGSFIETGPDIRKRGERMPRIRWVYIIIPLIIQAIERCRIKVNSQKHAIVGLDVSVTKAYKIGGAIGV